MNTTNGNLHSMNSIRPLKYLKNEEISLVQLSRNQY